MRRRKLLAIIAGTGLTPVAGCADVEVDGELRDDGTPRSDDGTDETSPPRDPPDDPEDRVLTDTNEVHPGHFTLFDGGVMIGAHPFAIDAPITVDVEWFDPTREVDPAELSAEEPRLDDFVEIAVDGLDRPWVDTPHDTGFFVALPVPEEFDESYLVPLVYGYGRFTDHTDRDGWDWIVGTFDPDERLLIVDLNTLGGGQFPTRVGVAEHGFQETWATEPTLEAVLAEHFPRLESAGDPREEGYDSLALDGEGHIEFLDHEPGHDTEFEVIWSASGHERRGLIDAVHDSLVEALPHYKGLENDPRPALQTTFMSKLLPTPTRYKYYIKDHEEDDLCEKYAGFYRSDQKIAVTCTSTLSSSRTTAHELFHAIQYGLRDSNGRDRFIVEGTARLMDDIDDLLGVSGVGDPRFLDVPLDDAETMDAPNNPYDREYFFYDLFHRENLDHELMGDMFDHGLETEDLEEWVDSISSVGTLADAHWNFAKNVAFEGDLIPPGESRFEPPCTAKTDTWLFDDGVDTTQVGGGPIVPPGDPDVETTRIRINEIPELATTMEELLLPEEPEPYYFELEFPETYPREFALYPGTGECETDTTSTVHIIEDLAGGPTDEDVSAVVTNWESDTTQEVYFLAQGPADAFNLRASGPYRLGSVSFVLPETPVEHDLDDDLFVLLDVTIADLPGMEEVSVEFVLDGEPISPRSTSSDPNSLVGTSGLVDFEFSAVELCQVVDGTNLTSMELEVSLSTPDGGDDVSSTWGDSDTLQIDPTAPALPITTWIEIDTELILHHVPAHQLTGQPSVPVTIAPYDDLDWGLKIHGRASNCIADLTEEIRWYDHETDEHLGTGPELFLSNDQLEDDDGTRIVFYLRAEVSDGDLEAERVIVIEPCEPFCQDHDLDLTEDHLEPVMICPDGSADPDCVFTDIDSLETDLEDRIDDHLFEGHRPATSFPLDDPGEWTPQTDLGHGVQAFIEAVYTEAQGDHELEAGNVTTFARAIADIEDELGAHVDGPTHEVVRRIRYAIVMGLNMYGAPSAGGQNMWRMFGYGIDHPNPNAIYTEADLRVPIQHTVLGAASALAAFEGDEPGRLLEKVELGAAYGLLDGVIEEVPRM